MRMSVQGVKANGTRAPNPLRQLLELGQSVWLDYIRQSLISSGELQRLIHDDGLRGITSNPAIFEQAIAGSREYADLIGGLHARRLDAVAIYETLAIRDIQLAADLLRPVYDSSEYRDGYVSFEVSPFLAHDTPGTLVEARRLSRTVARDNLMLKVPATPEGIAAFEQLTAEGISVNVTLLFSRRTYERVAQAYIRGLRRFCADLEQDLAIDALERHGEPIIRIAIGESYDLGAEFFRWELAVAVAGAVIRINPFNQPDVEASKQATYRLTEEYQRSGSLPPEQPFFSEGGISLFTDHANAQALRSAVGEVSSLSAYLTAHHNRIANRDYYALLAYVDRNAQNEAQLQAIRHTVRDAKRVATCLGFGPRFLHSTGQLYKGGPNGGVILQITCDDVHDLPVPGQRYTFGIVKAAQARGDFGVLAARARRVLKVHLSGDVPEGLTTLAAAMSAALR